VRFRIWTSLVLGKEFQIHCKNI